MITSLTNQKVKHIVQLKKKPRQARIEGVFLVEGIRMVKEIPAKDLEEIYVTEAFLEGEGKVCGIDLTRAQVVTKDVFDKISDTVTPQGVLAVARRRVYQPEDILSAENGLYILTEDVQDPGNLGTIFRSAEGAGVTGIVMTRESADLYNSKVIRSTMGAVLRMPFLYTGDLKKTMEEAIELRVPLLADVHTGKTWAETK